MDAKRFDLAGKVLAILVLVAVLLGVRLYEDRLFYDPFLDYFRNDYLDMPLPIYDTGALLLHVGFRYALNTVVSLAILYVLFRDRQQLKFTGTIYLFFFVLLMGMFFALLQFPGQNNFLIFYTRRFLIQPIFLLLFIPAFYYQRSTSKK